MDGPMDGPVDGPVSGRRAWLLALGIVAACNDGNEPVFESRCAALPDLPRDDVVALESVFGGVDIDDAVALVEHPTASRFYVVAKSGQVYTFTPDDADPELVVDLEDALYISGEAGLLDLEIDPAAPSDVYLSYNAPSGDGLSSRVSRFALSSDGRSIDRDSETIVLEVEQPYSNHNGGDVGFGPDGLLYFGLGDGGSAGDPRGHGQDTDTVLGAMLRIDVRDAPAGAAYGIPADNPFAGGGGAPEIFAWGFRNPWRWSFDRTTGALWVGDVGQHRWEEVDRVELGGNYGWGVKEGAECIGVDTCDGPYIDPVTAYRNVGSASVVGGAVVRGGSIADVEGQYLFSDFYDGTIRAVPADAAIGTEPVEVGREANGVAAWLLARDGTFYGVRYSGGIVRLVAREPTEPTTPFPFELSATGCIDVAIPDALPAWVVPYDINLPFWSDGATKQRFVAVPPGEVASVDATGLVQWPRGTVLGKTFWQGDVPIETRLLVRRSAGWVGYGYAWDADGNDATLVQTEVEDAQGWQFPGLRGCPACHTEASGGPLGTTLGQLDRSTEGQSQLAHLEELGLLRATPASTPLPTLDDPAASLDDRARAYLEVNCSPCHREEGTGGRSSLDLRRGVPLADSGLCESPGAGDLGIADAAIVAPGDPARSVLLARVGTVGDARMPPLGRNLVDEEGVALLTAWIEQLADCP